MPFETFPRNSSESGGQKNESRHNLESAFFNQLIASKIVDSYDIVLQDKGYTTDQINDFNESILALSPLDREYVYAFPWELKQRILPFFLEKINKGSESVKTLVEKILEASKTQRRRIAYHTSNENIHPKMRKVGSRSEMSWQIDGTEADHRDNDLPMAYYSYDYENLYRVKNPKYMYVVSIQEYNGSGHKKDGNNEWGRASTLSVVEKIDFQTVGKLVQELADDEIKNGQQG